MTENKKIMRWVVGDNEPYYPSINAFATLKEARKAYADSKKYAQAGVEVFIAKIVKHAFIEKDISDEYAMRTFIREQTITI
jgi:hypothetical protein